MGKGGLSINLDLISFPTFMPIDFTLTGRHSIGMHIFQCLWGSLACQWGKNSLPYDCHFK